MIYLILVLALILRLVLINQSFWLDEASQAMTSYKSVSAIVFHNLYDFHPPLSYVLTHYWIQVSLNEVWLRLLPLLFGVGTIYFIYLLGEKLFSKRVGLLAALLVSIAPYHIYYSQEFRMYSMATFFAIVSMYYFVCLIKNVTNFHKILFVLSSVALLYTHYLGGLLFIGQIIYLLLYERKKVKQFLYYYLAVGLLFVPWLPYLLKQLELGVQADVYLPGWSSMLSLSVLKAFPLLFGKFILGRIDFENTLLYIGYLLAGFSVVGLSLMSLRNKLKDQKVQFILLWLIVPIVITFLVSLKLPMFQPFRLLFCLPALFLLIAYGLSISRFKILLSLLVIFMLISFQMIFWFDSSYWREDWKNAVVFAENITDKKEQILFAWDLPFAPYSFYTNDPSGIGVLSSYPATFEQVDQKLSASLDGSPIVYFSYLDQLTDPQGHIQKWLELHNYEMVQMKDFRGVGPVYLYSLD